MGLTEDDPFDFSGLVGTDLDVSWAEVEGLRGRSDADERREALLQKRREE